MRPSTHLSPQVLDEDLQIILATLQALTPEISHLAPASSRALEEAVVKLAEARDAFDRACHRDDDVDSGQLMFPSMEASA
jgi:hypothetical protein